MRRSAVVLAILLDLVATACRSGSSSKSAPGTTGAIGQPDRNAVVNIAGPEGPVAPQGTGAGSTTYAYPFNVNVYEPLIYLGSDYTLKPGLAESWELIGGTTWRFHLRHGVTFHDGKPFTADDVMWTWADRQSQQDGNRRDQ